MTEPLRADIETAARRKGISMNEEMVERLSLPSGSGFDEIFSFAFQERAGLAHLVCEAIRRGGGSAALLELLAHVKVPDQTREPTRMVRQLISDLGFRGNSRMDIAPDYDTQLRRRFGDSLVDQLEKADRELNTGAK